MTATVITSFAFNACLRVDALELTLLLGEIAHEISYLKLQELNLKYLFLPFSTFHTYREYLIRFTCILQPDSGVSSARQSVHSVDTPRGSWASFDLRNSVSDPLIPSLLERVPPETIDQLNEVRRQEERQVCLFYQSQSLFILCFP